MRFDNPSGEFVASGTYAQMLATVSPISGQMFRVVSGNWKGLFRHNGTRWLPHGTSILTYSDPAVFTAPADALLNVAKQITIPGGWLGASGHLQITVHARHTSSANLKTYALQLAGGVLGYNQISGVGCFGYEYRRRVWNATASSQRAMGMGSRSFAQEEDDPARTTLVDTSVDQPLVFSVQKATAAEVITVDGCMIELYPG